MIIQPDKGTRNVNDLFYEAERSRIDMLNHEFFKMWNLPKRRKMYWFGCADGMSSR